MFASVHRTMSAWLRSNFSRVDLMVASAGRPLTLDSTPFAESALRDVAQLPEVAATEGWRVVVATHEGAAVRLIAVDPIFYQSGVRRFELLQGDERT